jgi:hypothetical protein
MLKSYQFFPWIVIGALGAQGCGGPNFDAICEEREKCLGGNDADIAACVAAFEGGGDLASDIGCGAEYDDYFACQEENAACRDVQLGGTCMTNDDCNGGNEPGGPRCSGGQCVFKNYGFDPKATDNPCESQENAYQRCF